MSQECIVEMRHISKTFPGVKALDDVNLDVRQGEVLGLAGENGAGKSTLMKILTGSYSMDEGEIILRGEPAHFANPRQGRAAGISMIHQEVNLVPDMNAAQNIFLGTDVGMGRLGVVHRAHRAKLARKLLGDLDVSLDVAMPVRRLSVVQQQMIEIAKALSIKSDILVMDEPSSALSDREIETLYAVIGSLKERGVTIIYISHRLGEIFDLSDRVTVLRDGRNVATEETRHLTMDDLVRMMVGREVRRFFHRDRPGSADWSRDKAKRITLDMLKAYPDIRGIYAANDVMALGVVDALKDTGRLSDVTVVGTDGIPSAIEATRAGHLSATVACYSHDYGRTGLELAIRSLEGETLPRHINWPAALVTHEEFKASSSATLSPLRLQEGKRPAQLARLGPVPAPSRRYKVGVVLKTLSNEHWGEMKGGYQEAAREYGVSLDVVAADSEVALGQQLDLAMELLDKGCDALCVSPLSHANLASVIREALERGIPVVTVDDAHTLEVQSTTFLTADQRAIGACAGEYLAQHLPRGSRVAMIEGQAGSQAAQLRRQGFYDQMKSSGLAMTLNQETALEARDLCTTTGIKKVSFSARWGEILGIAGLVGAGRTELMRAIFGADPIQSGSVYVNGQQVRIRSPRDAMALGMGFLTEDRKGQGLVLGMSVEGNATLTILDRISRWGVVQRGRRQKAAQEYVDSLAIKTPSLSQPAKYLSGGNQQKLVLAKWLASQARILIFDEPTRGIDVGAKMEVRKLINQLAKEGACVILISSELPELLGLSDRVIVLHEGRVTGEFEALSCTEEEILHCASGLTIESLSDQAEAAS